MIIGNDHRTDVVFKLTVTLVCCSEICRLDLHGSEEMQSGNVSPTLANVDADRRAPQELIRDRIIPGSPEDALESIWSLFDRMSGARAEYPNRTQRPHPR